MTSADDAARTYQRATFQTAGDLMDVATTLELEDMSQLSLPEIKAITEEIARVVPAGNVPGFILSGLARMQGRTVEASQSHKYVDLLYRGVQQTLNTAIFGTFFAGPAAVLYGYQQLLRLAGKQVDDAFPEGTWQHYLQMALREDSARHANETTGFHAYMRDHTLPRGADDELACWMLAVTHVIETLPQMLENEWRERVILRTLTDVAALSNSDDTDTYRKLYKAWQAERPYHWNRNFRHFASYRRSQFDQFWKPHYQRLSAAAQQTFDAQMQAAENVALPAYQQQMSWLAYLDPQQYREERMPYALDDVHIAVISKGRYYLIPLEECRADEQDVRRLAAAILNDDSDAAPASIDEALVRLPRAEQARSRQQQSDQTRQELDRLRRAPIIINWDERPTDATLTHVRQGKRGIGDHALTIFRTAESTVFDMSHIFFDGIWGAAIAEILTGLAITYAGEIPRWDDVRPARRALDQPALQVDVTPRATPLPQGTSAEHRNVDLNALLHLRKLLKQRSQLLNVTVNDLFVLYRALHAQSYTPSRELREAVAALADDHPNAHAATAAALADVQQRNPSLLIPLDATLHDPRERVFPTTFRNPLDDMWQRHSATLDALEAYQMTDGRQARKLYNQFSDLQSAYLGRIGGFGELLSRYKEVALRGESTSTASIKFLAHVPQPMQHLLNNLPGRFEILNDVIKGEEVFSNIGRVADGSSLRRFITAKDDNERKTLAWGIITDDDNTLHLSLRDFRPHVAALHAIQRDDLAQRITQAYLDAYADGLDLFVEQLTSIVSAKKPEGSGWFSWW